MAVVLAAVAGLAFASPAPAATPEPAAPPAPAGASAGPTGTSRPVDEIVREADQAFAREDFKAARTLYEEAIRRKPDHLDAGLGLAEVLLRTNDYAGSIDVYRTLRSRHPDDSRVLLGLGRGMSRAGRLDEADGVFLEMELKKIEPIQAHAERARLRSQQGRLDEAAALWRDVLRADPGNLDARIGLAWVNHRRGLDRTAHEQADNILLDHPESREAKELQDAVRLGLRPYADAGAFRSSDDDSNRVDTATVSVSFKAEPQTTVRIAYSTLSAGFRCHDPSLCTAPGLVPGSEMDARAQSLSAGVTSRVVGPILFNAHLGAVQEEAFDGHSRAVYTLGGFMRLQVGPRFAVGTSGGRDALIDTAPLIDRGIRIDEANGLVELRFGSAWVLSGTGGLASYSDGNARKTAGAALEWRSARAHPHVSGVLDARWRAFNADRDNGYFDPLRYDSEILTVSVGDDLRDGRYYWRLEGTYGRQAFTLGGAPRHEDTVQGGLALAGVRVASGRAAFEASYARSEDALSIASGATHSRSAFSFRYRF